MSLNTLLLLLLDFYYSSLVLSRIPDHRFQPSPLDSQPLQVRLQFLMTQ